MHGRENRCTLVELALLCLRGYSTRIYIISDQRKNAENSAHAQLEYSDFYYTLL